jgi:hypothetical protein
MNFNLLAQDIQESMPFLPRIISGRDSLTLKKLHSVTSDGEWKNQRKGWERPRLSV